MTEKSLSAARDVLLARLSQKHGETLKCPTRQVLLGSVVYLLPDPSFLLRGGEQVGVARTLETMFAFEMTN